MKEKLNIRKTRVKMPKDKKVIRHRGTQLPLFVEKDEDGYYVVECPLFDGCYSQGKTLDRALKNIREVIEMILDEKDNRKILHSYSLREISLHTITL